MIIKYLIDGIVFYEADTGYANVPMIGDKIFLDEIYFVRDVVHYPKDKIIVIHLDDKEKSNKVTETTVIKESNSVELTRLSSIVNRTSRDTDELKRQISAVRQQLKTQQISRKTQNDI